MYNSQFIQQIITFISILLLLFQVLTHRADAATQKVARISAQIIPAKPITVDKRAEILQAFLAQYDSPLTPYAHDFINQADRYNLDWRFVVSISGVESWFGSRIPAQSYNGWGWGIFGGRVHRFSNWSEGIEVVSEDIRERFMDTWGAEDIQQIGHRYAADPSWSAKVMHFMEKIEKFEQSYESQTLALSL
jgi:hypothetical protein